MGKKSLPIGSSIVYNVEYVEAEKVYSVQKIPILNLDNKKKRYVFWTGNR